MSEYRENFSNRFGMQYFTNIWLELFFYFHYFFQFQLNLITEFLFLTLDYL